MQIFFRQIDDFEICEHSYIYGKAIIIYFKGRFYIKHLFPNEGVDTANYLHTCNYNGFFYFRNRTYFNDSYPLNKDYEIPKWYTIWYNENKGIVDEKKVRISEFERFILKHFQDLKKQFLIKIGIL